MNNKTRNSNTSICNNRLFCSQCQNVIEFTHPMLKKIERDVCEQYNFASKSGMVLLSGVCRDCMSKAV